MSWLKKWRGVLSNIALVVIFGILLYWAWQNRLLLARALAELGAPNFLFMTLWLEGAYFFALFAFVRLIRSLNDSFGMADGFHALNIAQVASVLPGGIWGIAGLAGWLWSRGLRKDESAMVVSLNMFFSLGACGVFGLVALAATVGWQYAFIGLLPILVWVSGRDALEKLRARFFPHSASLPTTRLGLELLGLGFIAWTVEASCFTWLVFNQNLHISVSPLFVASAYAAGYLVGFLVLVAPAGLGVREGVLVALLGSGVGADQVLALALLFRAAQLGVQWFNVMISWLLHFGVRCVQV